MGKGKAPSQRQLRVGELVRHALTDILMRESFDDPVLNGQIITVSEVRMSPDLKIATCFVSPLGGNKSSETETSAICKALARNAKLIRTRAVPHLKQMKYMPSFRFLKDTSFDNYSKIDALLRSDAVQQDLEE